jgi:hypothetical protein
MGAIKAAKAAVEGLHGVFRKLAEEHGQVMALLLRVRASSDPQVRRDLFPEIRSQLLAHEQGELRVVYPAFMGHPELESMAKKHDVDARELEQMLDDLKAASYEDTSWKGKFDKLVAVVEKHVAEEENDYFTAAERVLGQEEAERLEGIYAEAKSKLQRPPS